MIRAVIIEGPQRRRRLDPSKSRPRSLDSVDDSGRPVLDWILHALRQVEGTEPLYVGGYHIEKIVESFPGLAVRYHQRRDEEGEVGALCCCDVAEGALLLLSASTVLLPGAIERLGGQPLGRGVYTDGRAAGAYFVAAPLAAAMLAEARAMVGREPMAGLEALFSRLPGVVPVDIDGFAAPVVDQEAVARTIFRGKAQTLDNLAPLVRGATFLPRARVALAEWQAARDDVLKRVAGAFPAATVVVRSSATAEDGLASSAAGKFRTVLDVRSDDRAALAQAIDTVIASYGQGGRSVDRHDEVLIQPQLLDIKASGVLLTRDPRSGAPYFVINEDRCSGRPDVVTSGQAGRVSQQFVAWSARSAKSLSPDTRRLVAFGGQLVELSHIDALDVEYAVDGGDTFHVLQVRPLAAARQKAAVADDDVLDLLAGARDFVAERMRPVAGLLGARTVLGVMPDWNPAEMIGLSPRPLALSLYQALIGADAWAEARQRIGYRDVRPEALIVALGGRPYVDVRASLNSFLPASLDTTIGARWVDACIERLRDDPSRHDKIEFEIALTCLAPDWDEAAARLVDAGIEPEHFAECLRPLTADILSGAVEPIARQLAQLDILEERRRQHESFANGGVHGLARRVAHHLDDCRRLGLVPFSILARYAFVSMSFLRGLLRTGLIDDDQYHGFLHAVPTVAGTIAADLGRDLPLDDLVSRYGHLRPNSYEITSPNYASDPEQFLRAPQQRGNASQEPPDEWLRPGAAAIDRLLARLGLGMEAERLFAFMADSIAGRERAKFEFMKSLDAALDGIASLGEHLGFDRDRLSFLPVGEILRLATDSAAHADRAQLRRSIAFHEKRWLATCAMRLPDVVRTPDEVLAFGLEAWRANFVTRKRVAARVVWLDDASPRIDLAGAIVLTRAADPGYDWIFAHDIAGLVTEYGGVASHMSIRAAEFGLPAAIGCGSMVMDSLRGAERIELDCASERVRAVA
jgi:hypothetical protein